jgi:predicted nuclease of predicted toxin-antitoxin system
MRLLLDQCLPRSTVFHLRDAGFEAARVGDMGLAAASDAKIREIRCRERSVVVTLDAHFHMLLALSGTTGPSVSHISDYVVCISLRVTELAEVLVCAAGAASVGTRQFSLGP